MRRRVMETAVAVMMAALITGCGNGNNENENNNDTKYNSIEETSGEETASKDGEGEKNTEKETVQEETTEKYAGPTELSCYMPDKAAGCRRRLSDFTGPWTVGKDILSIEVFASDEDTISSDTFSTVWKSYWNRYEESGSYKLGYELEFDTESEGKIKRTILEPDDIYGFLDYIEVYIYDDVNVPPNTWYSHLLQEQMNDSTYITSIKLTCGKRIGEVKNIKVTSFIYKDENDFDTDGNYRGSHKTEFNVYKDAS